MIVEDTIRPSAFGDKMLGGKNSKEVQSSMPAKFSHQATSQGRPSTPVQGLQDGS